MLFLKEVPSSPITHNSSGSLNRYQLSFTSDRGLVCSSDSSQNKKIKKWSEIFQVGSVVAA